MVLNTIEIRRPRIDDRAQLHQFFSHVIRDTFAREGLAELLDDIRSEIETKTQYLESDFDSDGKNRFFLIAIDKKDNKVIGSIEYGPVSELISSSTNGALNELVEVGTVFVHLDYQRRGVGTLLVNVILLTLQNRGIAEFCLDSGYTDAQKVWKKKFGAPDFVLKDYWGEGNDHMIWKRSTNGMAILFQI
jgi:GNAT superfamily N-acetyltransferase